MLLFITTKCGEMEDIWIFDFEYSSSWHVNELFHRETFQGGHTNI